MISLPPSFSLSIPSFSRCISCSPPSHVILDYPGEISGETHVSVLLLDVLRNPREVLDREFLASVLQELADELRDIPSGERNVLDAASDDSAVALRVE